MLSQISQLSPNARGSVHESVSQKQHSVVTLRGNPWCSVLPQLRELDSPKLFSSDFHMSAHTHTMILFSLLQQNTIGNSSCMAMTSAWPSYSRYSRCEESRLWPGPSHLAPGSRGSQSCGQVERSHFSVVWEPHRRGEFIPIPRICTEPSAGGAWPPRSLGKPNLGFPM